MNPVIIFFFSFFCVIFKKRNAETADDNRCNQNKTYADLSETVESKTPFCNEFLSVKGLYGLYFFILHLSAEFGVSDSLHGSYSCGIEKRNECRRHNKADSENSDADYTTRD